MGKKAAMVPTKLDPNLMIFRMTSKPFRTREKYLSPAKHLWASAILSLLHAFWSPLTVFIFCLAFMAESTKKNIYLQKKTKYIKEYFNVLILNISSFNWLLLVFLWKCYLVEFCRVLQLVMRERQLFHTIKTQIQAFHTSNFYVLWTGASIVWYITSHVLWNSLNKKSYSQIR